MRGFLFFCLFCFGWLLALPALAAGAGIVKESAPGTTVEMPYLIAPVVVDEKLVAYAYVSSNIVTASPSAALAVRNRIPFVQDAYVRDVNAQAIGKESDPSTVDDDALAQRMLADAKRMAGANEVIGVKIIHIQMSVLQPGS